MFISYQHTDAQGIIHSKTEAHPITDTVHGTLITDNYRWLEDKNSPKVKEWTHEQHNSTVQYLKTLPQISGLEEEIRSYLEREIVSAPFFVYDKEFFYKRAKNESQSTLMIREKNGTERVLFNPLSLDPSGKTAISFKEFTIKADRVCIGTQTKGSEINIARIIDVQSGSQIGEEYHNINGWDWAADEDYAYISIRSKEIVAKQEPIKTYKLKVGEPLEKAQFLIAPNDAKDIAYVYDLKDRASKDNFTIFTKGDFLSNTMHIRNTKSNDEPKEIYSSKEFRTYPFLWKNKLYFFTNHKAPNYTIMVTDIDKPEFHHWKTLIPESKTVLEGFEITSDYILVRDKKDILSRILVYDFSGNFIKELSLPELGNVGSTSYHEETNMIYVSLTSFTSPSKLYKLDGKTLTWTFVYQEKSPINTDNIEAKIVFYPSKDGTKVPMFIVHKKGLVLNGNNPTLLYGYGGFNNGISPSFIGLMASFINRGGVYARAGIRGGDEYGESWHKNGMQFKKQNTFDDFIAGAEYLIKEQYTSTQKLACEGGSNGGLLVGAVVTQRPDLFKVAVSSVPLLDMVRFHKFLIARFWIPEYGDPDKKEDFLNIMQYSPYHNIPNDKSLPALFVTAGENDVRVDPLHAKKFVAAVQNNKAQKNPALLYMEFDSGHGSGKSIQQQIDDIAYKWRFVMNNLGMK